MQLLPPSNSPLPANALSAGRGLTSSRIITYPIFRFIRKSKSDHPKIMHIFNRIINREYCHILLQKEHLCRYCLNYPENIGYLSTVHYVFKPGKLFRIPCTILRSATNINLISCLLIGIMSFISKTPPFSSYYKRTFFPEVFTIGVLTHTSIPA